MDWILDRNLILGGIGGIAALATIGSMISLRLAMRPRRRRPGWLPPITIFKPLKGCDEGLAGNLRSFFTQDYPEFQLLFCVADQDDPAISVVQRLQEEHPEVDSRLIVGCLGEGRAPKVESLATMDQYRAHDVLLISDSNVRVHPDYLRETVAYLDDPGVGIVSNLVTGDGERQPGAALENLHLNGYIAGGVAGAWILGVTCVVGKSMLMPGHALEAIGGFASVRNFLAEDQVIAVRVRKAGYSIRLSHHVITNYNQDRSLRAFLSRHLRWYMVRRRMALPSFLMEPVANLVLVGLVWALSGDAWVGLAGLTALTGLSIVRDALQTRWLRGSWPAWRDLCLLGPIKDLALLPVWFHALVNNRIVFRGNRLTIGHYTRLIGGRIPRHVRRRARRVRRLRRRSSD